MIKLSKTAIGLLTAQYRSVLRKCWAINVGIFGLMGKAASSVAKSVIDVLSMMHLLDGLLNIKSNDFDEQSAKATATKLPFDAPTVAGTLSAFGVNVMDGILLNLQSKSSTKLKALPVAVVAATIAATVPNEANAAAVTGTGVLCYNTSSKAVTYRPSVDSCDSGETRLATFGAIKSDGTVDKYATVVGYNNTASGQGSSAFGYQNTASGQYSSAVGWANRASGEGSSAVGKGNTASGQYSSAFGYQNTAKGSWSSAFGAGNTASGQGSSAVGISITASNDYSFAAGAYAQATGVYALALGNQSSSTNKTMASGRSAIAIGTGAQATHDNSVAIGTYSVSAGENTISVGNSTTQRQIKYVADGVDDQDAVTVKQLNDAIAGAGGGGGTSYTAGDGISIEDDTISLDTTYMADNYYTKSQADSAISTAVADKANQSDLDTLSGTVSDLSTTVAGKANASDVYTKEETNSAISSAISTAVSDVYSKDETKGLFGDGLTYNSETGKYDVTSGGGTSYTAGDGISIENDTVSVDTTYLDANYAGKDDVYTKEETSNAISTAVSGKQDKLSEAQMTILNSGITAEEIADAKQAGTKVAELETTMATKANADDVYTKTEVYTKSETNSAVDEKVTASVGDRSNYSEQNYISNNETVAQSLDKLDVVVDRVQKNVAANQAVNEARFNNIEHNISRLENKMRKGLAANNALAGLTPLSGNTYQTQLSIALGGYENNQAAAIGAFHYLTERVLLSSGVAYGGNDNISYNVGVTLGF